MTANCQAFKPQNSFRRSNVDSGWYVQDPSFDPSLVTPSRPSPAPSTTQATTEEAGQGQPPPFPSRPAADAFPSKAWSESSKAARSCPSGQVCAPAPCAAHWLPAIPNLGNGCCQLRPRLALVASNGTHLGARSALMPGVLSLQKGTAVVIS